MTLDYYAHLAAEGQVETLCLPWGLATGFVDYVSVTFVQAEMQRTEAADPQSRQAAEQCKQQTRQQYIRRVSTTLPVPRPPVPGPDFSSLPSRRWLGLEVDFELLTPWYSRDDRIFHLLENPVRKDRVFGVPFMAASSWKGLLRWACGMRTGLRELLEAGGNVESEGKKEDWLLHLFGNERVEKKSFHQGALVFYPTWFNKLGFEVINPHNRERRAGTQPIYYEVVPGRRPAAQERDQYEEGGRGTLRLLYAPWPGMRPEASPEDVLPPLLEAVETLLTRYGISAKRTAGWGTAAIRKWRAFHALHEPVEKDNRHDLWTVIKLWFTRRGTP